MLILSCLEAEGNRCCPALTRSDFLLFRACVVVLADPDPTDVLLLLGESLRLDATDEGKCVSLLGGDVENCLLDGSIGIVTD